MGIGKIKYNKETFPLTVLLHYSACLPKLLVMSVKLDECQQNVV